MFTLLKLGVSLVALLAFAWFGMTYKLGSRTLFEHLHAIGQTKESQELVDGTRQAVRQHVGDKEKDKEKEKEGEAAGKAQPPPLARDAGAPLERLSSSEQRQLRYLLDKAAH
jgi:hypothetical protein